MTAPAAHPPRDRPASRRTTPGRGRAGRRAAGQPTGGVAAPEGPRAGLKPKEHNLLGTPITETRFEPHVGGHIYDRAEDGSECHWARVLAYEPPNRVVFSWDIGPTWQIEADEANASEVEVRFIAETPERTRLELEHRDLDRHGPGWESVRDGVGNDQGWPLYLARYADVVAAAA